MEMNNQEKLVELMRLKAVSADTPKFFNTDDRNELLSWPDEIAEDIVTGIFGALHESYFSDENICPWCIRYRDDCDLCMYGTRHGKCDTQNSDYQKAIGTYGCFSSDDALIIDLKNLFGIDNEI